MKSPNIPAVGATLLNAERLSDQIAILRALHATTVRLHLFYNPSWQRAVFSAEHVTALADAGITTFIIRTNETAAPSEVSWQVEQVIAPLIVARPDLNWVVEVGNEPNLAGKDVWAARYDLLATMRDVVPRYRSLPTAGVVWCASLSTAHDAGYFAALTSDTGDGLGSILAGPYAYDAVAVHGYGYDTLDRSDGAQPWAVYDWLRGLAPTMPVYWTEAGIDGGQWPDKAGEYAAFVASLPDDVRAVTFFTVALDGSWPTYAIPLDGAQRIGAALAAEPDAEQTGEDVVGTSIYSDRPDVSDEVFAATLAGSPALDEAGALDYAAIIDGYGLSRAFIVALGEHEHDLFRNRESVQARQNTKAWGNQRSHVRIPGGALVTDPLRNGQYAQFATYIAGLQDLCYRLTTPNYVYVQEGRRTVETVIPRFAPATDSNDTAAYVAYVLARMAQLRAASPAPVIEPTGGTMPEIIDVRGQLAWNPAGGTDQRSSPKRGIIIHYSGPAVNRTRDTLELLKEYAELHIGDYLNERSIAYHYDIGNDARIRKLRDDDAVLWHCGSWPENATYYAVHVMLGAGQDATPAQLASLTALVEYLRDRDGIARQAVKGHQEVNSTSCPGTLMETFVLPYRAGKENTTVADGFSFPETGHYVGGGFWTYWRDKGGLAIFGYPLSEEIAEMCEDGVVRTVQYFERAVFEYHPDQPVQQQVQVRRLGALAAKQAGLSGPGIAA